MPKSSGTKNRGRTSITDKTSSTAASSKSNVPQILRREASRPVSSGAKQRGDRRDTSRLYTGNAKHSARGNNPRADVKTRKR